MERLLVKDCNGINEEMMALRWTLKIGHIWSPTIYFEGLIEVAKQKPHVHVTRKARGPEN